MLTMGSISACGKSESDKNGKNTVQAQTEDKTTEENKTEDKAEDSDTEAKEEADKNSESSEMENPTEEEGQDAAGEESDMAEDMTMKVLKESAGTIDYTALERIKSRTGKSYCSRGKNTKSNFWATVKKGMTAAVKDLNEKMGYKGDDKVKLSFEGPAR